MVLTFNRIEPKISIIILHNLKLVFADGQRIYLRFDQLRFNKLRASKAQGKFSTITIYDGMQENAAILGM